MGAGRGHGLAPTTGPEMTKAPWQGRFRDQPTNQTMHTNSKAPHAPRQGLCAGCGCALPAGTPALGAKAPNGTTVVLCLDPCGERAMADDIFAQQCVFAAMSGSTRAEAESLFKRIGHELPTNENAVRSIVGDLSRRCEAENPGWKAPPIETIMAAIDASVKAAR